jgi:hypothetical protein
MKYSFLTLTTLALLLLFFASCKKNEIKKPDPFVIRLDGRTFVMDSVVYRLVYANNLSSALHVIYGYSKSNSNRLFVSFENTKDTTLLGTYPVSTNITQSRVRDFSLNLTLGPDYTGYFYYNKVEADFVITITGKLAFNITGSARGAITGGNPVPGGFSYTSITNIRTVPVEIDFDTPFYNP